jgi:hypothetical protein
VKLALPSPVFGVLFLSHSSTLPGQRSAYEHRLTTKDDYRAARTFMEAIRRQHMPADYDTPPNVTTGKNRLRR